MSAPAIGLAWRQVRDRFRAAGIESAEMDARLIAQHAFGIDPIRLLGREREPADSDALNKLEALAQRRLKGEPVARMMGSKEFWSLDIGLNAATLVPRPETEMLVGHGSALLFNRDATILDLGTGSGAIAIALAKELSRARVIATEIASDALEMARANAQRHGVADRISFRLGSWYEPLDPAVKFDLIVSNPPYIMSEVIETLAPDVRDYDPRRALDGGWDGLEAYRAIIAPARKWLNPGGYLAVEIGSTQGLTISRMFDRAGFQKVELFPDLNGLDRMVLGVNP